LGAAQEKRPGLFERSEFPGRPERTLSGDLKCVAGEPDHDLNVLCAHWTQTNAVQRELLMDCVNPGEGGVKDLFTHCP